MKKQTLQNRKLQTKKAIMTIIFQASKNIMQEKKVHV